MVVSMTLQKDGEYRAQMEIGGYELPFIPISY